MFTFGVRAQVPVLTESFDGTSIPATWTTIDADQDGNGWEHSSVQEDLTSGHTGTGAVVSYSYDNINYEALTPDNWLISPAISLNGTSSLSFWFVVAQNYAGDHFGVYVSTTSATDTTAFTPVFEMTPTSVNGYWTEQTIDLSSYAGNTVYIAFRHFNCTDMFLLALDDITVSTMPTQPALAATPNSLNFGIVYLGESNVQTVNVGAYNNTNPISATVTAPFAISADSITFGTTAALPATGGVLYVKFSPVVGGESNAVLTLTAGTLTDTVNLSGTGLDCTPLTLPYTETFETTSPNLNCWLLSGDAAWTIGTGDYSASTGSFEGSYNAKITHSNTGNVSKLISPVIAGANNGLLLNFAYVMRSWAGDVDELRVYSRSAADGAWQQVAEFTDAVTTWTEANVIISGPVYQVAFEMTDHYGYGIGIDSVVFAAMAADFCYPVTALTANDITANGATLSWTGDANTYTIINMSNGSVVATVNGSDSTYAITGLSSETQYTYGVVANCTTSSSDTVTVSFTTLISCPVPTNLTVVLTPGNGTVASLSWNENGSATAWQICVNNDETNLINDTATTHNFTGLTPEQAYTVKVRAICDSNDHSIWSNAITFIPTNAYFFTVNEGTATNSYVPVYGLYVDEITESQFIIPAADLTAMQYGTINRLTFYSNTAEIDWGAAEFNVYLTETNDTAVTTLADYSTMTQVYAGTLTISNNKMEVVFNTPYLYMGGNLKVGFLQTAVGTYDYCIWVGATVEGASMGGLSTNVSQRNFLPKTTVYYTPGTAPSCLPVSDLTVSNIDDTQATITWTGTAASYSVYLDGQFVANVPTTSYTFTGLNSTTSYMFGVISVCSATDSSVLSNVYATTECGSITTYPYVQDFTTTPNCWMIYDADGDGYNWILYQGTIQSASYNSGALTPDNWLISPRFVIPATGNYEVTWTATAQDQSWPAEHYGVFVSTTGYTDTANFTMLQEWTLGPGIFNPVVDLSNYAGQNIYIALRHFNCTDQFRLSIDDFTVREQAGANQVTINVGPNNPAYGTVAGAGIYTIGDSVTVSATAASGYAFSKWVDDNNTVLSTNNPYTFVAATDLNLTAIFLNDAGTTYTITVNVNDSTMGTATGAGTYTAGEQVTLTATPFAGYNFVNWTQVSGFGENVVGTDPNLIITVTGDKTFVANFEAGSTPVEDSLTIHLTINDPTLGSVDPTPGTYHVALNGTLMITATPNDGVVFDGFRVLVNGEVLVNVPAQVNPFACSVSQQLLAFGEITVMAMFNDGTSVPDSLTLILNTDNPAMGTTNPAPGTYHLAVGESSVITALPNPGYRLLYWIETVSAVGMSMSDTMYADTVYAVISPMMANMTLSLTAYFVEETGLENHLENDVVLYPNPAKEYVDIRVDGDVNVKMMEVYDVYGKLVNTVNVIENPTRINVSGLANGVYFVRVSTEEGVVTKTFVKK